MARLFKRGSGGESVGGDTSLRLSPSLPGTDLPIPYGAVGAGLTAAELRETAYEIFVASCRTTGGKPLTYIPQSEQRGLTPSASMSPSSSNNSSNSAGGSLQRSLTSAAASKMKKALGLKKASSSGSSPGKDKSAGVTAKKPATVGELMRVQMRIPEPTDSRIRRGLLRIAAGQLGKRADSMVLPLEFLQQFKASDFSDTQEYDAWYRRNLKLLEAGLLLHPLVPLEKSDASAQRFRQVMRGALDRPLETGRNSESMQVLRSAVMSLSSRSYNGSSLDSCHWADGSPLNLHLYHMLLDACFDCTDESSVIEEIDEVIELIKKTWVILGINQMLHNLCFTWIFFNRFVVTGQTDIELLTAANSQLAEVVNDSKTTKDPVYSKLLSATLTSIMGWTEQRLLAYHDTFNSSNIESMQGILSLGVTAAKILVEDISHEYRRRKKEDTDVARSRVDTYIRSSLRTAFAQKMEEADSNRRSSRSQSTNSAPRLSILAKGISDLAMKEKDLFSPILKNWHPLAGGVAIVTLHSCYGNELKQFIAGLTELTPDVIEVLKAAHKLENDLLQIAVEDFVDSEDGGKSLIREMPPFEAETAIGNLVKSWIKTRIDRLKDWVERSIQQETWSAEANRERCAPSAVEVLRNMDGILDAFFELPIPMHPVLLPELTSGLDRSLQNYASKVKSGCGTRNSFMPTLPPLTRCDLGSKIWGKKEKTQTLPRRGSQVGSANGDCSSELSRLCVRLNTLNHIRMELENIDKKIKTCLRNVESAQSDIADGLHIKFEFTLEACQEGIQQLCETTAYKVIFHDMSYLLWESLYVGDPASSRVDLLVGNLDKTLEIISGTAHDRVRSRMITALMKASFDGFLLVLVAGGPMRAFSLQDSQIIAEDFRSLRNLYLASGDGLPEELVDKAATQVNGVLHLFRTDTESLIARYKQLLAETLSAAAKSKYHLPPTSGRWGPTDANTVLRVLCYRKDEAATKFLKKTYNLPKKLQ